MFWPFLPQSFSQGMPSPSPSIFVFPDFNDFTASAQLVNCLQVWADAARGEAVTASSRTASSREREGNTGGGEERQAQSAQPRNGTPRFRCATIAQPVAQQNPVRAGNPGRIGTEPADCATRFSGSALARDCASRSRKGVGRPENLQGWGWGSSKGPDPEQGGSPQRLPGIVKP